MSVVDVQNKQVDIALTGGLLTDIPTADVPPGLSPNNQDCDYFPRAVNTRYGIGPGLFPAIAGNPTINYLKTFRQPSLAESLLSLDSNGAVWQASTIAGGLAQIGTVVAGSRGKSATLFGREFIGFSDGQFGIDIPRGFDGTYFDRVSQVGPGAPPTVADSAAAGSITIGVHQLVVLFITRTAYIPKPSPPVSWSAAGGKKAAVTNIPTGPPNVIARILAFTAAGAATWFYLPAMIINDNVTTTATIDFTDTALIGGTPVALLFNKVELGEVSGFAVYANRLITWGERNKVANFLNLSFDGGFNMPPASGNQGPQSPSAAVDGGFGFSAWANPGNVLALDGVFASTVIPGVHLGEGSNVLNITGFGFTIPANATISGIVVKAYVKASTGVDIISGNVFLLKNGVRFGSGLPDGTYWPTVVTPKTYGSQQELWGITWTPSDINNANFGFSLSAFNTNQSNARTAFVDFVSIQVYYTVPGGAGQSPLGWTQGANFAGGDSAYGNGQPVYWGDAFYIKGDGATAIRGQITQSAYQDYLNVPIIARNTAYRVRVRVASAGGLTQGTLHINLQSTSGSFTTPGLSVQANQAGPGYVEFDGLLTTAIVSPPTDLLLQVYADGTPNNGGVFLVDNIEVYPANQPYLANQGRASTAFDPETFDGVNGLLQPPTNEPVRTAFVITDRSQLLANDHLYLVTDNQLWRTQDNGGNPSTWGFSEVSLVVGTPSINGVDVGEDWVVIAHPSGLYLYYFGQEPTKIAQEVQTITAGSPTTTSWDSINWQNGYQVWVKVDLQNKRVLVGAPVGAGAALPNKILMMNYRGLVSSTQIIGTPPMHPSYTGRFIAQAIGRKWSSWTISANCCWIEPKDSPLAIPNAAAGAIFLGNSAGNGKIYNLTSANGYLDDGQNIPSFYDTAFVPSDEQKEQYGMLGSLVYLSYLRAHMQGSGNAQFTFFGPDYVNSKTVPRAASPGVPNVTPAVPAAPAIALASPAKNDIETFADFIGERINVRIQATGQAGSGPWFSAQKLELFLQPNPTGAIRGFN